MKKGYNRFVCFLLVAVMLFGVLPLFAVPADGASQATALTATVEQQIRAFADSIDQKDADTAASWNLANHGMTKGGKKLSVGKKHALTATLFNSEVLQSALTDGCTAAINMMQRLNMEKLQHILGSALWYGDDNSSHEMRVYDSDDRDTRLLDFALAKRVYVGKRNAYDASLDWMAGTTAVTMDLTRTKVTADAVTYRVNVCAYDRFDFAIKGNDMFKDLISGMGALFFKEFDWESKVTFDLTVPNPCHHSMGNHRWTYDPESQTITSNSADGWMDNEVTRHTYEATDGTISYYYELEKPVWLFHDRPWVLEYDILKPGAFVLSPLETTSTSHPHFQIHGRTYLSVCDWQRVKISEEMKEEFGLSSVSQTVRHYHGLCVNDLFKYSSKKVYTYRMENQVNPDGSNMIYLTVRETETGEVLVDRIPMDDYYKYEVWIKEYILMDEEDDWVSGKDLNINCIGNKTFCFKADGFDLRVWENGENSGSVSHYNASAVTVPSCTAKGYTTYICDACGHSKKDDYVAAAGHSWGDWEAISETHRQRSCSDCGEAEQEEIPAFLPGDINGDGGINNKDLTRLFQHLSGWDVEVEEQTLDINGDGAVNNKDLTRLFQYLSGWDVEIH